MQPQAVPQYGAYSHVLVLYSGFPDDLCQVAGRRFCYSKELEINNIN